MNGFTLTEILVVVLVIGILASVAIPHYFKYIERGKASEAVDFFIALQASQARYQAKYGAYCIGAVATCGIDATFQPLIYFNNAPAPAFSFGSTGSASSWKLTLTRNDAPVVYGAYQLTYDVEPSGSLLSCVPANPCTADLLPSPN
jgi:prepilin-type N-terminal cleavage/methylation domain-containing protein